jgi:hypothetical protein
MEYFNDSEQPHARKFEECWCHGLRTFERHENGAVLVDRERTKALLMHCWETSDYNDDHREDSTFEQLMDGIADYMAFSPTVSAAEFEADDLRQQVLEVESIIAAMVEARRQIMDMIPAAEARVAALEEAE